MLIAKDDRGLGNGNGKKCIAKHIRSGVGAVNDGLIATFVAAFIATGSIFVFNLHGDCSICLRIEDGEHTEFHGVLTCGEIIGIVFEVLGNFVTVCIDDRGNEHVTLEHIFACGRDHEGSLGSIRINLRLREDKRIVANSKCAGGNGRIDVSTAISAVPTLNLLGYKIIVEGALNTLHRAEDQEGIGATLGNRNGEGSTVCIEVGIHVGCAMVLICCLIACAEACGNVEGVLTRCARGKGVFLTVKGVVIGCGKGEGATRRLRLITLCTLNRYVEACREIAKSKNNGKLTRNTHGQHGKPVALKGYHQLRLCIGLRALLENGDHKIVPNEADIRANGITNELNFGPRIALVAGCRKGKRINRLTVYGKGKLLGIIHLDRRHIDRGLRALRLGNNEGIRICLRGILHRNGLRSLIVHVVLLCLVLKGVGVAVARNGKRGQNGCCVIAEYDLHLIVIRSIVLARCGIRVDDKDLVGELHGSVLRVDLLGVIVYLVRGGVLGLRKLIEDADDVLRAVSVCESGYGIIVACKALYAFCGGLGVNHYAVNLFNADCGDLLAIELSPHLVHPILLGSLLGSLGVEAVGVKLVLNVVCQGKVHIKTAENRIVVDLAADNLLGVCKKCVDQGCQIRRVDFLELLATAVTVARGRVQNMYVCRTNVALVVLVIVGMKSLTAFFIDVRAGCLLPVLGRIIGPFVGEGVLVSDLVRTNVAQAVLVCVNVRSKTALDLTVLAGSAMPVLRCVA